MCHLTGQVGKAPLPRRGAKGTARQSRNRSQNSFNAETQRARRNAEEKSFFFHLSLRPSANLCVSALILCSLRANRDIAKERNQPCLSGWHT
jgi:hypothetical protein